MDNKQKFIIFAVSKLMIHPGDSFKDWEDILEKFGYLFRHDYELLRNGWILESEFFEDFFELVLKACEKMAEENER